MPLIKRVFYYIIYKLIFVYAESLHLILRDKKHDLVPGRKKFMKKSFLVRVIVIIIAMIVGRGIGYLAGTIMSRDYRRTTSSQLDAKDLVVEHKVVKSTEDDGLDVYNVIFYGKDSHLLKDLYVEYVCDKEWGYTAEGIDLDEMKEYYPLFAEISVEDYENYVVLIVKMKDLNSKERIKALVDKGVIELIENADADVLDADFLYKSYIDIGYTDAPITDYELLDLSQ